MRAERDLLYRELKALERQKAEGLKELKDAVRNLEAEADIVAGISQINREIDDIIDALKVIDTEGARRETTKEKRNRRALATKRLLSEWLTHQ